MPLAFIDRNEEVLDCDLRKSKVGDAVSVQCCSLMGVVDVVRLCHVISTNIIFTEDRKFLH